VTYANGLDVIVDYKRIRESSVLPFMLIMQSICLKLSDPQASKPSTHSHQNRKLLNADRTPKNMRS
jgi:hypothetical protein